MQVICIEKPSKKYVKRDVTVGNIYTVIAQDAINYDLIDDTGDNYYYQLEYFEEV